MKIHAFILCYNEELMIRHTLNHYTSFCDRITILDNESNDATLSIIKTHFPDSIIIIKSYNSGDEIREDLYLEQKNHAWKGSDADYVISCDMDELLYAQNIKATLQNCKDNGITLPIVEGYNMFSHTFPYDYTKPLYEQVTMGVPSSGISGFSKQIIFDPKAIRDINFRPGCHLCDPLGSIKKLHRPDCNFKLLHYHFLNKDIVKVRYRNYALRLSRHNKENGFAVQYLEEDAFVEECFGLLEKHAQQVIF